MPATNNDSDVPRTQFAIVVDLKSRGSGNLEQVIASFGPSYQLLPNVWIVSSDQTANAVRNLDRTHDAYLHQFYGADIDDPALHLLACLRRPDACPHPRLTANAAEQARLRLFDDDQLDVVFRHS